MKNLFLIVTILLSSFLSAQDHENQVRKFDALLQYVEFAYVDSVKSEKLVEDAIVGLMKELDPHSVYIPSDELKKMNEPLEGNFEGVGIQFNIREDTLLIVATISGGPSEKVGLRSGDKIIEVDGDEIAGIGLKNSDVTKLLRGDKGTKVNLAVQRRGVKELLDFTITRDKIPIFSVDASYMATPDIGYIKINRFARTTMDEFNKALKELKAQNMKHLILDLQGNGGGYLNTAHELADQFLTDGQMIVYTDGRSSPRRDYKATAAGEFEKGKLVVLIDEGSASASEIVSGAVQDHDRGYLIGRRTFGKGLVQKPFGLPDGSAIRLTTARYYTPVGRCIQRPYDKGKDKYYEDLRNRYKNGELMHKDSIDLPDSLKFYTLHNKREVYGGGGVMPDVFIPLDTTMYSAYFGKVNRKGILNDYVLDYIEGKREQLKGQYASVADFKNNFDAEKMLLKDFIKYAEKKDVKEDKEQIETSKKVILIRLKAILARNIWGNSAFYEIHNELSNPINKGIEAINGPTFKKENINY